MASGPQRAGCKGKGKAKASPARSPIPNCGRQKPLGVIRLEEGAEQSSSITAPNCKEWRKNIEICRWAHSDKKWKKYLIYPLVLVKIQPM